MRPLITVRPRRWLCCLLLLLPALAQAQVTVHGARWEALQPTDSAEPASDPRALSIAERIVLLRPTSTADGLPELAVRARWTVGHGPISWLDLRLADASVLVRQVTIDGEPAPIYPAGDGAHVVARLAPGSVIELVGARPGDVQRAAVPLTLLAASSGLASIASDLSPQWTGGVVVSGELWGGASQIGVQLVPPSPPRSDAALAVAEAAMGVTVSDDGMAVRAHVRHLLRRGSLDRVLLTVPGAGADLAVTGPNVGAVSRSGDRLAITLREPTTDLVALNVTWTAPVPSEPEAQLALPTIRSGSASRTAATLQLAREGDVEVLPSLTGWTATASTELPTWGRGLVSGAATATFTGTERSSGTLSLLRFVPVQGPEVMVDIADVLLATSSDGRVLLRARYEVLNDRAAVLPIRLPPNSRLLSLTVADQPAGVSYDADGTLRVPLRRSIESLGGLLSFPVELAVLVDADPWARRERRVLPLPQVYAPVAVLRTTAHLPPGFTPWATRRLPNRVDGFSRGEGITYGIEIRTADDRAKVTQADALFGAAVRAWEGNEFEEAQELLLEIDELGGKNFNVERLQGNLSLILDDDEDNGDGATAAPQGQAVVLARRVREQAKAKASEEEDAWEDAQREAEFNYRSGDYKKAEEAAEKALVLGKKLQRYEQSESAEVSTRNDKTAVVLAESRKRRKSRRPSPAMDSTPDAPVAAAPAPVDSPPPALLATTRSVLIPELGAPLRFQSLLLPPGAAPTVTLGARAPSPLEPR